MRKVTVSRMRERYAQSVLTFRLTYLLRYAYVLRRVKAFGPDTHPSCLHLTSNQQQLENQTAYVVTIAIVVSS